MKPCGCGHDPRSVAMELGTAGSGAARLADVIARGCPDSILLNDRRPPEGGQHIDHIAVSPAGVWVIDAERYSGHEVAVGRSMLGRPRLTVGGRDATWMLDRLRKQVPAVREAVAEIDEGMPVHGVLCLEGAELPEPLRIGDELVMCPPTLTREMRTDMWLSHERMRSVAAWLAASFPTD